MVSIRLAVPETANQGEVIEIKALIQHEMESGFRRGSRGEAIPRDIITAFECKYNGEQIFSAEFHPAIAANPILTFHTIATESGTLTFTWQDQHGQSWSEDAAIEVT